MLLEGARWNYDNHLLDNSLPKELYTDIPLIWFLPKDASKDEGDTKEVIIVQRNREYIIVQCTRY